MLVLPLVYTVVEPSLLDSLKREEMTGGQVIVPTVTVASGFATNSRKRKTIREVMMTEILRAKLAITADSVARAGGRQAKSSNPARLSLIKELA